MEVVAKKYPRLRTFIVILVASILLIAIGAGLIIASGMVVNFPDVLDYIAFALIIIGAACTAMMIFTVVRFCLLPKNLITYEKRVLTFPNGFRCRAEEVETVTYIEAKPYYKNISYDFGFGQVIAVVNGKKVKALYAERPAEACERLKVIV